MNAPPTCHSESASAVRNLLHRFVIPNPLPPRCHSESASAVRNLLFPPVVSGTRGGAPCLATLCDVGFPLCSKQIPIRVRLQAYRQRRTPAGPRPSGATATARSFTLPSHQSPAAHESWVCSRRVVFGREDSGELKECFYIAPVALQSAGDSARCFLQFALFGGGRKGRGRHIGSRRGLSCGRGRFRLRLRKRCHYTGFGGRGCGGRGRPRHTLIGT